MDTNRIDKEILLHAAPSRVWRALTDAGEFGTWFRVKLDAAFAVGRRVTGHVTYPGYEHLTFEVTVERMDPEDYFSFRWHPYAIDLAIDYSAEPTTLVEFRIEAVEGGTLLKVTESGFERIPAGRRAEAIRMNDGGWATQINNIRDHVAR